MAIQQFLNVIGSSASTIYFAEPNLEFERPIIQEVKKRLLLQQPLDNLSVPLKVRDRYPARGRQIEENNVRLISDEDAFRLNRYCLNF